MWGCVVIQRMDLFWVMLAKGVVLGLWAVVSEIFWPEDPSLYEQGSGYSPPYSPLCLPAPKDTGSLAD